MSAIAKMFTTISRYQRQSCTFFLARRCIGIKMSQKEGYLTTGLALWENKNKTGLLIFFPMPTRAPATCSCSKTYLQRSTCKSKYTNRWEWHFFLVLLRLLVKRCFLHELVLSRRHLKNSHVATGKYGVKSASPDNHFSNYSLPEFWLVSYTIPL